MNLNAGTILFYKMKNGNGVYKRKIKELSPSRTVILVEESPKKDIWVPVDAIEILDLLQPNTPLEA